ncbi:MAG: hypothetical protein L0Y56_11930 [Nitrospira sp.]|nr:hypothetical protein [Nitrospira sp.]
MLIIAGIVMASSPNGTGIQNSDPGTESQAQPPEPSITIRPSKPSESSHQTVTQEELELLEQLEMLETLEMLENLEFYKDMDEILHEIPEEPQKTD